MALDPEDKTTDRSQHWLDEIEKYQKASKDWRADAKKIIDRYRLERSNMQEPRGIPAAGQPSTFSGRTSRP